MLSANPSATPAQIFTALEVSSENPNTKGRDDEMGYGIVNALAAVEEILKIDNGDESSNDSESTGNGADSGENNDNSTSSGDDDNNGSSSGSSIRWSKVISINGSGASLRSPPAGLVLSTSGAKTGSTASRTPPCATRTRPSNVVATPSPRSPPSAISTAWPEDGSISVKTPPAPEPVPDGVPAEATDVTNSRFLGVTLAEVVD